MSAEVVASLKNISVEFPGVRALDDVSLDLYKGEILGLLGENGSGKSTLIKCLSGVNRPQAGELLLHGKPVRLSNSVDARALGISTVYQEFSLVPTLSVAENIFLGRLIRGRKGFVDWRAMHAKTCEILGTLEINLEPDAIISNLSVAEQQLVEIAKGFAAEGSLMILDEPTTALAEPDIRRLHELLRRMAAAGHSIIYISHRLDEIMDIVDRVVILRNGRLTGVIPKADLTIDLIVEKMSGHVIADHYPKERNALDEVLLKVEGLFSENGAHEVSFEVRRGEVFGLAGLLGSGRTEIARALFGVDKKTGGRVYFRGKEVHFENPRKAIAGGMAFVTENRKTDGLFFNFNGPKNSTTANLSGLLKSKWLRILDLKRESELYGESMDRLQIHPLSTMRTVGLLSGGNQQKVVVSRWLFADSDLFIMDEPTQGIDVNARLLIYHTINELTRKGKGILLISSDYLELFSMSDRIATVRGGRIIDVVDANNADSKSILSKNH